jgi:phytochelatin synthase
MQFGARLALTLLLLATVQLPGTFALDPSQTSSVQELVPFSSDEGLARLARSTAKVDFPALANQFEPQSNPAFCGPTSAAIVLNAVYGRSADLPRDRSRLRAEDLQYVPSNYDPTIPRFTQDNVITKGRKCGCRGFVAYASRSRSHPASNPAARRLAPAAIPRAPPRVTCSLRSALLWRFQYRASAATISPPNSGSA